MGFQQHFLFQIDPVAKSRPRFARRGKFVQTYTPAKTQVFEDAIKLIAKSAIAKSKYIYPRTGPLEIWVIFFLQKPRSSRRLYPTVKPDLDNFLKGLCDSLNGLIWDDDSQIVSIHAKKAYIDYPLPGRISLFVKEYS